MVVIRSLLPIVAQQLLRSRDFIILLLYPLSCWLLLCCAVALLTTHELIIVVVVVFYLQCYSVIFRFAESRWKLHGGGREESV